MTDVATAPDSETAAADRRDRAAPATCDRCGHARQAHEGSLTDEFAAAHGGSGIATCGALVRHGESTSVCACRIVLGANRPRPRSLWPAHRPAIATIPAPGPTLRSVRLVCDEVTTLDPITGQPDFERVTIEYVPDRRLVETKSLKAYWRWWRTQGASMERFATLVADDVLAATDAWQVDVSVEEAPRGGISIIAAAALTRPGAADRVDPSR